MNEKDYIERMKKEIDDLREKSDKLQVFVNENRIKLDFSKIYLMDIQLRKMYEYIEVLNARISLEMMMEG